MSINLPKVMHTAGSFNAYLSYVNNIPMLDEEQEKRLFKDYQEKNDLDAIKKIVLSHLRFVAYIARSFKGYGLPMEDLVQEGTIGLMKSVKNFKSEVGVRLSSFAIHYIKAEIQEYVVRNWRLVKATTTKAKRKLFFNLRRLKSSTDWLTHKDKQQVAEELKVTEADINEMEIQMSQSEIYVQPISTGDDDDISVDFSHLLEDKSEHFTATLMKQDHKKKVFQKIREMTAQLDERSRDIIENRWLSEKQLTQKKLAEKYGVSKERIRQIEEATLLKMREKLVALNS
ncbi:RNA polymerase factor sigma-32 [Psychromonas sp. KJ10-10]|uniref:RNA polymerase factor sigma-32 n=1 Tax=Psychromonas sp. KJ10-10 TaxID=3391823 RepID=UPI0039B58950